MSERRPQILIVDDERTLRLLTGRILEAHGFGAVEAENGVEALGVIEADPSAIDLVLTDLLMPVMNGRELGEAIHLRWPALPVLYMSAYAGAEVVGQGLLSADTPFVRKPFTPDVLMARIRDLLDGWWKGRS